MTIHKTSIWRILFSEEDLSGWAESYCRMINDYPEVRNYIKSYMDVISYYLIKGDDDIIRNNVNMKDVAEWYLNNINTDSTNHFVIDSVKKLTQ